MSASMSASMRASAWGLPSATDSALTSAWGLASALVLEAATATV
jgi:hypothetical protein